nr:MULTISPECIES: hypothetical protein [unclassified Arthrobacter]
MRLHLQWIPGQECEEPDDRPQEDWSLDQLIALGVGAAFYEYDFGDSWLHRLELVSRRPADEETPPARLSGGAPRVPAGRLWRISQLRGDHGSLGRFDPSWLRRTRQMGGRTNPLRCAF